MWVSHWFSLYTQTNMLCNSTTWNSYVISLWCSNELFILPTVLSATREKIVNARTGWHRRKLRADLKIKGPVILKAEFSQCLTKPRSKPFSVCRTLLGKHHLSWTVSLQHYTECRLEKHLSSKNNPLRNTSGSPEIS